MNSPLLLAILSAACFGTWPVISRFATGVNPGWFSLLVALGTLAGVLPMLNTAMPAARGAAIVLVAGAVNGVGMLMFVKLLNTKGADLSRVLPMVYALMPVFTVATSMAFLHEPMNLKRGIGIALAIAALFFLN